MEENTLSVLKIAPGQHPQQVEIDNNLKALQEAVGYRMFFIIVIAACSMTFIVTSLLKIDPGFGKKMTE